MGVRAFVRWVAAWTAIGFLVRVGYVLVAVRHHALAGDPAYFHGLATMLRHGHGWNDPYRYGFLVGKYPTATHPPLYPLALTASSFVGFDSVVGHRIFSCLIGTAAIPLIALAARRYGTARAGVIAAAIAAIYPYLWVNDVSVLSESLLTLVIAVVLLLAEAATRSPTLRLGALLGGAIALATLTRAEEFLLVPLLALPLLARGTDSIRERLTRVGTATVVFVLVLAPWMGWNLTRFDHPVLVSTDFGGTLFNTSCDQVWKGPNIGWWVYAPPCPNDVPPSVRDESTRDQLLRSSAWKYISAHVDRAPIVVAARVGRVWGVFNPRQTRQFDGSGDRGTWPTWIGLILFYPLLVLALIGLTRLHRRHVSVLPFVALALVVTITAALFYGSPHFRVPAEVATVVLAAVAIDSLLADRRGKSSRVRL
jgi:4-amino-4-deoxy-L-arabinose transferase-like glycosyltransferase